MNNIIFFNPRSGKYNHTLPLSILQIAASIRGRHNYVIVDGNLEKDPGKRLGNIFSQANINILLLQLCPGHSLNKLFLLLKR